MNEWLARVKLLQAGETITFRAHGNSMTPRIQSGDTITVEPAGEIGKGDIVLCKVKGRFYVHLVKHAQGDAYTISNNHGHVNGVVSRKAIYGRVIFEN